MVWRRHPHGFLIIIYVSFADILPVRVLPNAWHHLPLQHGHRFDGASCKFTCLI